METKDGGEIVLDEVDGCYTFNSTALTYKLINIVKEHQEVIEQLQTRIVELEN